MTMATNLLPSVALHLVLFVAYTSAFHTAHLVPKFPRISSTSLAVSGSYLDQLSSQQPPASWIPAVSEAPATPAVSLESPPTTDGCISHAPHDYFALSNLQSKPPRVADWGIPTEATRKLAGDGMLSTGAWYCSEGGWPSPNPKVHTEVFYVLEGHACLTDADGMKHYFGPGDTVVIPKGHTGRWDVYEAIRKIWAVNSHARIEDTSNVIRAQVDHFCHLSPQCLAPYIDPLYSSSSSDVQCQTLYGVGPTSVGVWTGEAGSTMLVTNGSKTFFYLLEGVLYISNTNTGEAWRCEAGDTVLLPQGWSGHVDVIETAMKIWTIAD